MFCEVSQNLTRSLKTPNLARISREGPTIGGSGKELAYTVSYYTLVVLKALYNPNYYLYLLISGLMVSFYKFLYIMLSGC